MIFFMQGAFGLLCHDSTLLAHSQLTVHEDPEVLLCRTAFQSVGHQCVLVPRVIPPLAFHLGEISEIPVSLFLQSVKIHLDGSMNLWCTSHLSQFCIICEFAEGAFSPIILVINEDVEHYWPLYQCLGHTTTDWSLAGFCATDHSPLGLSTQAVSQPPHCPLCQQCLF